MSENSGKDGKATTGGPAKPVKVVGGASKAPESSSPSSAAQSSAAKSSAAKAGTSGAAQPVKKAAPAGTSAPSAKKAAPAAAGKPAAKPAPATAAPAAAVPPVAEDDVESTAVRPGFGAKLKGGLDKATAKAEAAAEKARTAREERREGSDEAAGAVEETRTVQLGNAASSGRSPRHARLRLSRIDPWSVARVAFLLSVALGIVLFVAVAIVWGVLGAAGVWDAIDSVIASVASNSDGTSAFKVEDYAGTGRVLGLTLVVSVVNVVLLTAMATLAAYLYNMAAALLGGVEVTLSEDND